MSLDGFITIDSSIASSSSGLYVTGLPGVTIAQLDGLTRDEQADFEAFFENLYVLSQVNLKIDVQRALAQRFHIDKKILSRETSKFLTDTLDGSAQSGVKIDLDLSKYSLTHLLTAEVFSNYPYVNVEDLHIDWEDSQTTLTFFPLDGVYAKSKFVVVGQGIATSTDGITWTERTNPNTNRWRSVTFGNGRFVAVAGSTIGNDTRVIFSSDGITWTEIEDDTDIEHDWRVVKWIEELNLFVAGGSGGLIMTSTNGQIWEAQTIPGGYDIEEFVFGNDVLVGVTGLNGGEVIYSTNGSDWSVAAAAGVAQEDVAFGNGVFVSGANGGDDFLYSTDGITWTAGHFFGSTPTDSPPWGSIIFNGEYFVAVSSAYLAVSADGINWYEAEDSFYGSGETNALIYGNDTYVFLHSETTLYGVASNTTPFNVFVYDTDEDGELLGTFSKDSIGSGRNIIQINTSFSADNLFVTFTPLPAGYLRTSENKYFPTDSYSSDNLSCLFPCSSGGQGSVTQINDGGLNVKFNAVCSFQKFIEENINLFQYALWYRIGVDLMKERIVSDRVTRAVIMTPERAKELLDVFNEDYKAALDSATMNIKMNEDPICFICKRPIKAVTSLP